MTAKRKTPKKPESFSAGVGRGLRRSAKTARKIARLHGTPVYFLEERQGGRGGTLVVWPGPVRASCPRPARRVRGRDSNSPSGSRSKPPIDPLRHPWRKFRWTALSSAPQVERCVVFRTVRNRSFARSLQGRIYGGPEKQMRSTPSAVSRRDPLFQWRYPLR